MPVTGFYLALLVVDDVERSVDFYKTLLGIEPGEHETGEFASFDVNGVNFALHRNTEEGELSIDPAVSRGAGVRLHFATNDIDAQWRDIEAAGITPDEQPEDQPWGVREFGLTDPDGYFIEFVQRL